MKIKLLILIFMVILSLFNYSFFNVEYKSNFIDNKDSKEIQKINPSIIDNLNLNEVYQITKGENVKIALIDTGISDFYEDNIQYNDKEIPNGIDDDNNSYIDDIRGWNVFDDSNDTYDWSYSLHGTQVASTIIKYAPNVKIIPIIFIDPSNSISDYSHLLKLLDALNYAEKMEVDIIVMPFNYFVLSPTTISNKFQELHDNNIILLASAGNCAGSSGCDYIKEPARNDNIFAIGSIDQNNIKSSFSSEGPELDFVIYGQNIPVETDYGVSNVNGTSFSVGIFSSIVALFKSYNKDLSVDKIYSYLKDTANNLGDRYLYGNGLPNLYSAIKSTYDTVPPILDNNDVVIGSKMTIILSIQEENVISHCQISMMNLNDSTIINDLDYSIDPVLPVHSISNLISISISFTPIQIFQINITLIDANFNNNTFSFKYNIPYSDSSESYVSNSISSSQSNSYSPPDDTDFLSTGSIFSTINSIVSSTTKNSSLNFPLVGLIFIPFISYAIRKKKNE